MGGVEDLVAKMRNSPKATSFRDLHHVCVHYFGDPRRSGGSHEVFKTPWAGDPRVNIQDDHGQAKAYQVRQVIRAIDRLAAGTDEREGGDDA
ncbi:MAG: hypothetical protein U0904_02790 [Candidatus Nanopelagicales bacterium]|nr:hypothetical protein [Candidatus Nanopelagicales bacterium]